MKHVRMVNDKEVIVHAESPIQDDMTLCNSDHFAEDLLERLVYTNEKIDCHDCITLIKYAKTIKNSELSDG